MAWTGNFKDQISALTNGIPDETEATQWTLDGCYDVLERGVRKSGEDETWKFLAKSGSISSGTTDVDEIRTIAAVSRDSKMGTKGKAALSFKYKDAGSIYEATVNHPIWWIEDSTLNIYPAPTGGATGFYYYIPEYTITSWGTGVSSIADYPSEYYYHTMLYTAIKVLHAKMTKKAMPTFNSFVLAAPAVLDIPNDVIAIPNISGIAQADITENIPSYFTQSIDSTTLGALTAQTIDDLSISAAPPAVPTMATVTYSSVTPAQMDAIGTMSVSDILAPVSAAAQSIVDTDIDNNKPTYPTTAVPVPPSIDNELTEMRAFITDEDTEMADAKAKEINAKLSAYPQALQTFQSDMGAGKAQFDKESVVYQQMIQEALANAQAVNQAAIQGMQKDVTMAQQNLAKDIDVSKTNISNDLTRSQLNAQQKHSALMQDAQQAVQAIIGNNTALMGVYQHELSLYNAQVDNQVKEYQQNVSKTTSLWQATNSTIIQEYGARVQDELNRYNSVSKQYDAHVQTVMAKFQNDAAIAQKNGDFEMQADNQNYTLALERWQKSLALHTEKVNSQIGEYTQNLQKHQADLQVAPAEYQWLQDQFTRLKMEYEQLFGQPVQAAQ